MGDESYHEQKAIGHLRNAMEEAAFARRELAVAEKALGDAGFARYSGGWTISVVSARERDLSNQLKARRNEVTRLNSALTATRAEANLARRTLLDAGWTYVEGAFAWKPPLGPVPDFIRLEAADRAVGAAEARAEARAETAEARAEGFGRDLVRVRTELAWLRQGVHVVAGQSSSTLRAIPGKRSLESSMIYPEKPLGPIADAVQRSIGRIRAMSEELIEEVSRRGMGLGRWVVTLEIGGGMESTILRVSVCPIEEGHE